jgi:hypothetical protein
MDKVAQPFDYIVEHALKEQLEFLTMIAIKGNVADWGEYKYHCGQIRGIHFAMDCLRDARKRAGLDGDLE